NQTTMEMFLKRSIQRISKEATSRRLAGLRESCSTTMGSLHFALEAFVITLLIYRLDTEIRSDT
ncbi:MAG: hypothetical protein NXI00_24260, partial [Cytophagales bacterium]|nr:hypothetical protein [Cytophagales bacterium]